MRARDVDALRRAAQQRFHLPNQQSHRAHGLWQGSDKRVAPEVYGRARARDLESPVRPTRDAARKTRLSTSSDTTPFERRPRPARGGPPAARLKLPRASGSEASRCDRAKALSGAQYATSTPSVDRRVFCTRYDASRYGGDETAASFGRSFTKKNVRGASTPRERNAKPPLPRRRAAAAAAALLGPHVHATKRRRAVGAVDESRDDAGGAATSLGRDARRHPRLAAAATDPPSPSTATAPPRRSPWRASRRRS